MNDNLPLSLRMQRRMGQNLQEKVKSKYFEMAENRHSNKQQGQQGNNENEDPNHYNCNGINRAGMKLIGLGGQGSCQKEEGDNKASGRRRGYEGMSQSPYQRQYGQYRQERIINPFDWFGNSIYPTINHSSQHQANNDKGDQYWEQEDDDGMAINSNKTQRLQDDDDEDVSEQPSLSVEQQFQSFEQQLQPIEQPSLYIQQPLQQQQCVPSQQQQPHHQQPQSQLSNHQQPYQQYQQHEHKQQQQRCLELSKISSSCNQRKEGNEAFGGWQEEGEVGQQEEDKQEEDKQEEEEDEQDCKDEVDEGEELQQGQLEGQQLSEVQNQQQDQYRYREQERQWDQYNKWEYNKWEQYNKGEEDLKQKQQQLEYDQQFKQLKSEHDYKQQQDIYEQQQDIQEQQQEQAQKPVQIDQIDNPSQSKPVSQSPLISQSPLNPSILPLNPCLLPQQPQPANQPSSINPTSQFHPIPPRKSISLFSRMMMRMVPNEEEKEQYQRKPGQQQQLGAEEGCLKEEKGEKEEEERRERERREREDRIKKEEDELEADELDEQWSSKYITSSRLYYNILDTHNEQQQNDDNNQNHQLHHHHGQYNPNHQQPQQSSHNTNYNHHQLSTNNPIHQANPITITPTCTHTHHQYPLCQHKSTQPTTTRHPSQPSKNPHSHPTNNININNQVDSGRCGGTEREMKKQKGEKNDNKEDSRGCGVVGKGDRDDKGGDDQLIKARNANHNNCNGHNQLTLIMAKLNQNKLNRLKGYQTHSYKSSQSSPPLSSSSSQSLESSHSIPPNHNPTNNNPQPNNSHNKTNHRTNTQHTNKQSSIVPPSNPTTIPRTHLTHSKDPSLHQHHLHTLKLHQQLKQQSQQLRQKQTLIKKLILMCQIDNIQQETNRKNSEVVMGNKLQRLRSQYNRKISEKEKLNAEMMMKVKISDDYLISVQKQRRLELILLKENHDLNMIKKTSIFQTINKNNNTTKQ